MSFESIITHLNAHHSENLVDLVRKFSGESEIQNATLKSVDYEGLELVYNGSKSLHIDFPAKANDETLKNIIIELCMSVKKSVDYGAVKDEIKAYKAGFGSVCVASLSACDEVLCTYAPIIQTNEGDYIYISEIGEHFASIKAHPNNLEIMFLQDEQDAPSVILRKRLRYRANAEFIERGAEFERVYDEFERVRGKGGGIHTIRGFADFHLIKLHYTRGSFVKGFGQAYHIDENGELKHHAGKGGTMPHAKM